MSRHHYRRIEDEAFAQLGASPRERAIRRQVRRLARFYRHLSVYAVVIGGLWILNAIQVQAGWMGGSGWREGHHHFAWWAIWPTLGWGIGIALHAAGTFARPMGDAWQERKVRELMDRDLRHSGPVGGERVGGERVGGEPVGGESVGAESNGRAPGDPELKHEAR